MEKIDYSKIENTRLSSLDQRGRTFIYEGKFYRGIFAHAEKYVREMFDCGLVEELVQKELIPETKITEYYSDEFPLILEHELIAPVTYIFEWTYHMLCDTADMILRLKKVLEKYGYKLWDCHTYNVLFKGNTPVFVDFGSIYSKNEGIKRAFPLEEFRCDYLTTAKLLRKRGELTRCTLKINDHIALPDILNLEKGLGRSVICEKIGAFLRRINRKLYTVCPFYEKLILGTYERIVKLNNKKNVVKCRGSNYPKLEISSVEIINSLSNTESDRFNKIIDLIKTLGVETIYEWGQNNGLLALFLCGRLDSIKNYYYCDNDDCSADNLYCFIKENCRKQNWLCKIMPVVGSFFDPIYLKEKNGSKRMKSDLVISCEEANHLLLEKGVNIDVLFETFASYTRKYFIVEFMPFGLWDGMGEAPELPEYYSLEWFLGHMSKHFDVEITEQIEKNSVLILGKLK